jgi:ABC-type lipoprotein export system ATPase subunit
MELLREVAATATVVLMATHDRVAVEYADRVANMEDGRLATTSTT